VPLFVELIAPEWTGIGVGLIIALVVDMFEGVRAVLQTQNLRVG